MLFIGPDSFSFTLKAVALHDMIHARNKQETPKYQSVHRPRWKGKHDRRMFEDMLV